MIKLYITDQYSNVLAEVAELETPTYAKAFLRAQEAAWSHVDFLMQEDGAEGLALSVEEAGDYHRRRGWPYDSVHIK